MPTTGPGLFITKGMEASIPAFSISIDENGEFIAGDLIIHTGLDMCPYWLEIAYEHLLKAEDIHNQLIAAKNAGDNNLMGDLLGQEFVSGMQAIMAGCIALDSYYASIKNFSKVPENLREKWKEKGTARYKQIAETLKMTFVIPQETFKKLFKFLKQSFELRDKSVHPKSGTDKPVLYQEIGIISDWRYSAFRYANAKAVVGQSLNIIHNTAKQGKDGNKEELKNYCENLLKKIDATIARWEERNGKLL